MWPFLRSDLDMGRFLTKEKHTFSIKWLLLVGGTVQDKTSRNTHEVLESWELTKTCLRFNIVCTLWNVHVEQWSSATKRFQERVHDPMSIVQPAFPSQCEMHLRDLINCGDTESFINSSEGPSVWQWDSPRFFKSMLPTLYSTAENLCFQAIGSPCRLSLRASVLLVSYKAASQVYARIDSSEIQARTHAP